jgi:hypothetical protein
MPILGEYVPPISIHQCILGYHFFVLKVHFFKNFRNRLQAIDRIIRDKIDTWLHPTPQRLAMHKQILYGAGAVNRGIFILNYQNSHCPSCAKFLPLGKFVIDAQFYYSAQKTPPSLQNCTAFHQNRLFYAFNAISLQNTELLHNYF